MRTPISPSMQAATIYEAFGEAVSRHPEHVALMHREGTSGYEGVTHRDLHARVTRVAAAIRNLGVVKGDRIAILAGNGPQWTIADLAALRLGAIVVPVYPTLSILAVQYILNDAGAKVLFVGSMELLVPINAIRAQIPSLEQIILFDAGAGSVPEGCLFLDDLLRRHPEAPERSFFSDLPPVSGDDPATIVYTSGTTGEPKGVVLTHSNILSNVRAAAARFRFTTDDVFLSFLPLCHMFEKTCGFYTMLLSGVTIAYARDLSTIVEDVQLIRPTILVVVPRLLEKVYEAVSARVTTSSALRRRLVAAAIHTLNQYTNLRYRGSPVPLSLKARRAVYDRLVASKFRQVAGGRLRLLVSGGAPLDPKLAKTLLILGFNILEGYGLTETSPLVAVNALEDNRLGTVGKPVESVEVRIGSDSEVLVRGPNVMKGYFNKPVETKAVIDEDGWLHTGDQGRFDERGNLVITGRIKEILVTSYGKNVAPVPIEERIKKSKFVEDAMLLGDGRGYLTALIVPERTSVESFAKLQGLSVEDYRGLLAKAAVQELMRSEIEEATGDLSRFERVRGFRLVLERFTVDNGLLTPTLKLRRSKIIERYGDEIESMYVVPKEG